MYFPCFGNYMCDHLLYVQTLTTCFTALRAEGVAWLCIYLNTYNLLVLSTSSDRSRICAPECTETMSKSKRMMSDWCMPTHTICCVGNALSLSLSVGLHRFQTSHAQQLKHKATNICLLQILPPTTITLVWFFRACLASPSTRQSCMVRMSCALKGTKCTRNLHTISLTFFRVGEVFDADWWFGTQKS